MHESHDLQMKVLALKRPNNGDPDAPTTNCGGWESSQTDANHADGQGSVDKAESCIVLFSTSCLPLDFKISIPRTSLRLTDVLPTHWRVSWCPLAQGDVSN